MTATLSSEKSRTSLETLPTLTSLRVFAAILVFSGHAFFELRFVTGGLGDALHSIFGRGGYVLNFFFILSGFVLAWNWVHSSRPSRSAFVRRRLAKLFPNHLVTLALAIPLGVTVGGTTAAALGHWLPWNILLLQDWRPEFGLVTSGNSISWSLSAELLFYLLFPLVIGPAKRVPERFLWAAVGTVGALILGAVLIGQFVVTDQPRLPYPGFESMSFNQLWFVYFAPPVRFLDFLMGIFLARLVIAGRWIRLGVLPAAAFAILGYVTALNLPYLWGVSGLASIFVAPLIASAAVSDVTSARSVIRGRVWVRLGELSYAFYMVHYLVLNPLRERLGPNWSEPVIVELAVVLLIALPLTLLAAWLLYTLVEMPVTRLARGRRRGTGRATATATATASPGYAGNIVAPRTSSEDESGEPSAVQHT
ncbi:acyltransferase family protein [Protofrankia coriariae]|uniref:acyltransferase family protein n=1 Tax=Protofrankia coriariae TaxID=1562887 RepID=UPI00069A4237|nr:acyltransferase [Protofrankia coriariae]